MENNAIYAGKPCYTAWLTFDDFEAGEMAGGILEGYCAVGADVVVHAPTVEEAQQRAEETAKRMAFEEWSAPDTRQYDDLSFHWTGALATD